MSEINEPQIPNEEPAQPEQNQNSKKRRRHGKRKFVIGAFIALFIVVTVVGIGFAKHRGDKFRGDHGHGFMIGRIIKDLDLTAQQKTEVDKIKEEIKAKMQENRSKRQETAGEFEQMFRGDTFDKQKALELAGKRDAQKEEMKNFMVEQTAKVHALLTPDQRNKAADKMKEMREKRKDRKHKGDKDKR